MAKSKSSSIEIIYQDSNLLAVNKPSDMSVTKDRSGKADVIEELNQQLGDELSEKLRLIHRLDKQTSGVMIIAKNYETQSKYSSLFEKREINKTYLALVRGYVPTDFGRIKTPISHDKEPGKMKINPRKGKQAETLWYKLADFGLVSLLAVKPVTGRTHQIRVHMKSIGLPLAIDPLYSTNTPIYLSDFKPKYRTVKNKEERPLIERLTLHAYQIELPETEIAPESRFIAPLDKKFQAVIKMLAKHNPNGMDSFTDPKQLDTILSAEPLAVSTES